MDIYKIIHHTRKASLWFTTIVPQSPPLLNNRISANDAVLLQLISQPNSRMQEIDN